MHLLPVLLPSLILAVFLFLQWKYPTKETPAALPERTQVAVIILNSLIVNEDPKYLGSVNYMKDVVKQSVDIADELIKVLETK